ncbi:hypothetical protein GCM10012275_52370 [Longimycelium tulufanense]|uniref:Uncharacterized protein n=1 Tax=Longimycelium tulufanense TaxID=907463 RepID=A0A8J3CCX1_9PSEU|nr:hypothetical protein GCM10012275_52370 [Longimycelium tulufanense]
MALEGVRQHLCEAYSSARSAQALLAESHGVFADVGRYHPEPLTPPELPAARDRLDDALRVITTTLASLDAYTSQL